ncbi:MAG: extracellular solute-binding protein [Ruminococcaceae bacterium]|nr:extracellular solute-binding protein [Oscillospiraceae bacterium]
MNALKKIICILMVLCFIGTALVGCSKKQNGDAQNSENGSDGATAAPTQKPTNEYGEPSFTTAIPVNDLDFEGEELTMLLRNNVQNTREWYKSTTEDELDEAIAMRNSACEETLNVQIEFEFLDGNGNDHGPYTQGLYSNIQTDVNSDLHYYDIGCNFSYYCASPLIRDYAANLLDTEQFPYFDFSLPCWNQSIVEDTTFNDQLFYVAGDSNISMFDAAMIMWYNKTLYDKKREDTDPVNIQDLALAGGWTYDELYRWAQRIYEDNNGVEGKQADDTYGFGAYGQNPCPADCLPYAWDLQLVVENNDKTHEFAIAGNEKAEKALTMYRNLLAANGSTMSTGLSANTKNFAAGCYVFYNDRLFWNYDTNMMIREMEDKYGLLPMPKFDAEQEEYGTTSQDYYNLYMIIDHSGSSVKTKGEAISAFLQLANEESYTGVRGYYFNRIIKPKFFGTDDSEGTVTKSIALFDIIISNIEFDYMTIYSIQLANVNHLWRSACYDATNASLESRYSARQAEFEKAIIETDAWLGLRSAPEE